MEYGPSVFATRGSVTGWFLLTYVLLALHFPADEPFAKLEWGT